MDLPPVPSPAVIDRELGYAQRLRLNTVRVFLNQAVYEHNPRLFLQRLKNFLTLRAKHKIRAMPVLFDGQPAAAPEIDKYAPEVDWNRATVVGRDLPAGPHTVRVTATGRQSAKSSFRHVQVVDVVGRP